MMCPSFQSLLSIMRNHEQSLELKHSLPLSTNKKKTVEKLTKLFSLNDSIEGSNKERKEKICTCILYDTQNDIRIN